MADTKVKLIALLPLHEDRYVAKDEEFEVAGSRASLLVEAGMARMAGASDKPKTDANGNTQLAEWKKKISPAEYVERHPDGPAIDLAKAHVAREAAEKAAAEAEVEALSDETPVQE